MPAAGDHASIDRELSGFQVRVKGLGIKTLRKGDNLIRVHGYGAELVTFSDNVVLKIPLFDRGG